MWLRHYLPVLLAVLLAPTAIAQWVNQAPRPTQLDVRGVAAPTAERVFLSTADDSFDDGGALWDSDDGGATWTQRDVPFGLGDPLNGIFFLDDQNGWTFGNDNYRTSDGGDTWEELPFLGSTYFMEFYTPGFGVATGNFGRRISRDGGLSWEASPNNMGRFAFADDLTGLGVADSAIYRTTDGGATFALVLAGDAEAVAFLSSTLAVAIVDDSFARSTDGGATWTVGEPAAGHDHLVPVTSDVVVAWSDTTYVPNDISRLMRSDDGGRTWTDLGDIVGEGTLRLEVVDAQTVIAADVAGSLFRSTDAGATWVQVFDSPGPRPSAFNSSALAFADALAGYAAFGPGFVIKTTDGGATWSQISSGVGETLYGIDRFPDGSLIAVGADGTVLTNTGADGAPWVLHEALSDEDMHAVHVVGADSVVAMDYDGRVYRSSDGGETWTEGGAEPIGFEFSDLHFETLLEGWVVGQSGVGGVQRTTDGGDTWAPVPDLLGTYVSVDFEGDNGWVAGAGEFYVRTTDGGATWSESMYVPGVTNLNDMDFVNETVGYAVGWYGYAARSDDGGLTWHVLTLPEGNEDDQVRDLHLLGENELWMTTVENRAYYSPNGGTSWTTLDIGSTEDSFYGIAANAEGDAWTVGWQGYVEHFMGPPGGPPNLPPVASFDVATFGLTAHFTDTSTDADGTIVGHAWDFGDGATSTEQNPSHTYAAGGFYDATLTVTDDDGATDDRTREVFVETIDSTFGEFTEVTPAEFPFITQEDDDFWVRSTAPADYDADGDLDLAVLGYHVVYLQNTDHQLLLFTNEGVGASGQWDFTYVEVPLDEEMTTYDSDMAWGDVDADGDQDLVVGSDRKTVLYLNDDGSLVQTPTTLPGYDEHNEFASFDLQSITWADYDNDGDQDLLIPSVFDPDSLTYRTALMRNDGDDGAGGWTFTKADSTFAATRYAQSAWADYDDDNDLDLLLVGSPTGEERLAKLYTNEGGGVFTAEDLFDGLTVQTGNVLWQDYDADGDYDFLVAGTVREPDDTFHAILRIYENDQGSYTARTLEEGAIIDDDGGFFTILIASWADYDADGDVDILAAGSYFPNNGTPTVGRAKIFRNDGTNAFELLDDNLPSSGAHSTSGGVFTWFDLDNDDDLDYFIAGRYFEPGSSSALESQLHLYRVDVEGTNLAPSVPPGLTANVSGNNVTLAWNPAGDDSTPSAALTYDLALYHGGAPVATPHRLPEAGSVSTSTEWTLTGLPEGTYTWTVRAVDNAYEGGPIAEGAFTVGDATLAYDLEATNTSPLTVKPGGQVDFDYSIANNTTSDVSGDLFAVAERGGNVVARQLVRSGTLPANQTVAGSYVQQVPGITPPGRYTYRLIAGDFPDATADEEVFEIVVEGVKHDAGAVLTTNDAGSAEAGRADAAWPVTDASPWTVVAAEASQAEASEAEDGPASASESSLPEVAALEAAYPNPFSRATTLRFAVPEAADVTLAVYDLMGRRVAELVGDHRPAGFHEVLWGAAGLASGTYFVRFTTRDFAQTRRVVLMR